MPKMGQNDSKLLIESGINSINVDFELNDLIRSDMSCFNYINNIIRQSEMKKVFLLWFLSASFQNSSCRLWHISCAQTAHDFSKLFDGFVAQVILTTSASFSLVVNSSGIPSLTAGLLSNVWKIIDSRSHSTVS